MTVSAKCGRPAHDSSADSQLVAEARYNQGMRLAILAAAFVLVASGCSDGGTDDVLPFSEIQASDFSFEADPLDPDRGIFRVTTTEPSICSITWGPTEALGNLNNSLSMNGTGIIQHDVILPGARGGETYFFSVQGSTADGRLFRSEVATFTLPEADAASSGNEVSRGANLALTATVIEVSSEFNSGFSGAKAIDGDMASEWSTRGDGDGGFLTLDLGSATELGGFEFVTRSMADGSAITTTYTVTVDDGEILGPFPAGSPAEPAFQAAVTSGRILRFDIETSTGGNTGAVEIRVFGPQA